MDLLISSIILQNGGKILYDIAGFEGQMKNLREYLYKWYISWYTITPRILKQAGELEAETTENGWENDK